MIAVIWAAVLLSMTLALGGWLDLKRVWRKTPDAAITAEMIRPLANAMIIFVVAVAGAALIALGLPR